MMAPYVGRGSVRARRIGDARAHFGIICKVPGSPIGFGDDAKARQLLQQALALDPNGLDANYFWGDVLYDQGAKAGAKAAIWTCAHATWPPNDRDMPS